MKKLRSKIQIILGILTGKYKHCFLINIPRKDLENMLSGNDYGIELVFYGVERYLINTTIKNISSNIRDTDIMLQQIEFEVKAEEFNNSKT